MNKSRTANFWNHFGQTSDDRLTIFTTKIKGHDSKKTLEPCYSSKLMKWRQGYFLYGNFEQVDIFMFLAIFGEKFQKIVKWALWSCWGENLAARKHFCRKSLKQNISLFPKLVEAFTHPLAYLAAFLSFILTSTHKVHIRVCTNVSSFNLFLFQKLLWGLQVCLCLRFFIFCICKTSPQVLNPLSQHHKCRLVSKSWESSKLSRTSGLLSPKAALAILLWSVHIDERPTDDQTLKN